MQSSTVTQNMGYAGALDAFPLANIIHCSIPSSWWEGEQLPSTHIDALRHTHRLPTQRCLKGEGEPLTPDFSFILLSPEHRMSDTTTEANIMAIVCRSPDKRRLIYRQFLVASVFTATSSASLFPKTMEGLDAYSTLIGDLNLRNFRNLFYQSIKSLQQSCIPHCNPTST